MIGEEREAREDLLHRWVAEGKLEWRTVQAEDCNCTNITEYRVAGGVKWWSDRKRLPQFPSVQLIARLQIDMVVFRPESRPEKFTPKWHGAEIRRVERTPKFDWIV